MLYCLKLNKFFFVCFCFCFCFCFFFVFSVMSTCHYHVFISLTVHSLPMQSFFIELPLHWPCGFSPCFVCGGSQTRYGEPTRMKLSSQANSTCSKVHKHAIIPSDSKGINVGNGDLKALEEHGSPFQRPWWSLHRACFVICCFGWQWPTHQEDIIYS